ncbi:MAG: hypothetical protein RLZZ450_5442 [Pseudomonadota bacterium]|jgi:hypothetical protein
MAPRPPVDGAPDASFRSLPLLSGVADGFTRLPAPLRIALCVSLAIGLYALLGFKLAPTVLRTQAIAYVREHYGRTLQVGHVRVHPFALRVEVDDLMLPDVDGQPMLGWEHVSVNFEALASLWQRAYVLHEIVLRTPKLRAISRADGSLNLADLGSRSKVAGKRAAAAPPALTIERLSVSGGQLEYVDRARSPEFAQQFSPVSFSLRDFHTTAEGGAFALSAQSAPKARFWWKGDISLAPALGSSGSFAVSDFSAATVAAYLDDAVPFEVSDGLVGVAGTYRVSLRNGLEAELRMSKVQLDDVAVHARGTPQDSASVSSIAVHNATIKLREAKLWVDEVSVRGLSTRAILAQDGKLNLARLFTRKVAAKPAAGPDWELRVRRFSLDDSELALVDRAVDPPVELTLAPLSLELTSVHLDASASVPFVLRTTVDEHCTLQASGTAAPGTGAVAVDLALQHAPIGKLQPYIQRFADLTVRDGLLDVRGSGSVTPNAEGPSTLAFDGDVVVENLKTTDNQLDQAFVDIGRLELSQLRYRSAPESLHIVRVGLHKPYARLVLSREQTLNAVAILHGGKRPALAPAAGSLSREHPLAKLELEPVQVVVDAVAIDDMRLSFTDHFIKPNFSAELHDLSGTLDALSSDPGVPARVALTGRLGSSAPVSISGSVRPFAYEAESDLSLRWDNVPLAVFNPYSGRFAGYSIVRGDLASALHYKLKNGKLDAQHHIRLNQLTWGDATDTKESAGLPVRLATAMLRDRNGVIALDIPVQGKLSDPTFRVGPLVWQAVQNIAVRAATAPFEWLGSLFEGAERARFVDFAPGDAELSADDSHELRSLAKALVERPKLWVDVPLGVDRELDRTALVERKYVRALRATTQAELWGKRKSSAFGALDRGDKLDVLEALYEKVTGKDPQLPEPPEPPAGSGFRARRAFRRDFEIATLERLIRAAIKVEPSELTALGLRRADAIEKTLVAGGGVDSARVLVSSEGKVLGQEGKVRFELALK